MKLDVFEFNRIGRVRFLAYTNLSYGVLSVIYYLTIGFDSDFSLSMLYFHKRHVVAILVVISFIPIKFLAQRYRDLGVSGWWALVGLIPHTFFLLYVLLGCFKGEPHPNKHGKIPEESGVFLKLLAFLPLVLLIGLGGLYYYQ